MMVGFERNLPESLIFKKISLFNIILLFWGSLLLF